MNNPAVRFGIITGVILLVYTLALYFIDSSLFANMWMGLIGLVVVIFFAVKAIKAKKNGQGNLITLKDAFMTGFVCLVIAGLIGMVANVLVFEVIDPDMKEEVAQIAVDKTVEMMESFGAPAAAIDEALDEMKDLPEQFSFKGQLMSYLKGMFLYAFIALILAAIMKSKKDELIEAGIGN